MLVASAPAGRRNLFARHGRDVAGASTVAEAMDRAGLNYHVERRAIDVRFPTAGGDFYHVPTDVGAAIVRTDTGAIFALGGRDYTVVSNADVFSVFEPMLDAGLVEFVNGGTMYEGRDAFLQARVAKSALTPRAAEFFGEEGIDPLASVLNNFGGRRRVMFFLTPIRFACENTIRAAVKSFNAELGCAVKHTTNVRENYLRSAAKSVENIVKAFDVLAGDFAALRHRILTADEFERKVLDVAIPDPSKSPKFNAKSRKAESSVERARARRAEVARLWTKGAGHTGDASAYEAWNGLVEALDHDAAGLWTSERAESRLSSDFDGAIGQAKTKVYRALVGA